MQIIHDIALKRCEAIKTKGFQHKFIVLGEGGILDDLKNGGLEENYTSIQENAGLEKDSIFSKENIAYYLYQLEETKDISYIDEIKEGPCIKKEVPEKLRPVYNRFFGNPHDFIISKVLFTKDNQYAIFVTSSVSIFFHVYMNDKGTFVPFRKVFIGVY